MTVQKFAQVRAGVVKPHSFAAMGFMLPARLRTQAVSAQLG
jgi:hypothetical protein